MTIALPTAPAPAPRRQILVATAIACSAAFMLIIGMIAMWLKFRAGAPTRDSSDGLKIIKDWMPAGVKIPEVAANVMLTTFPVGALMAQWAAYSAKRNDRTHTGLALGVTALLALATINAQIAIWTQMGVGANDGAFHSMFYAATGAMTALLLSGLVYTAVAAFRYLGGRTKEVELVSAHALYWYFLTAAFCAVWFVIYVQK